MFVRVCYTAFSIENNVIKLYCYIIHRVKLAYYDN